MKRENKKALTATRNENRARAISNLQTSNAKLRADGEAKDKTIAKLETEVAALKAASS